MKIYLVTYTDYEKVAVVIDSVFYLYNHAKERLKELKKKGQWKANVSELEINKEFI